MDRVEWNPEWHTGVKEIDNDHKKLIEVVNIVLEKCGNNADKRQLRSATNKLMKYVGSHFEMEEKILEKRNYPHLDKHKETHLRLMYDILAVKNRLLMDNYNQNSAEQLRNFLFGPWLIGHLQGDDLEYANYFRQNNVS
jgi:hemerythrin